MYRGINLKLYALTLSSKSLFSTLWCFPEDFEIQVSKLIHMWVIEGFIQLARNASLEEMTKENLLDLVDRNLVLVEQRRADGGIKTCQIHDMLHDMRVKKPRKKTFLKKSEVWNNLFIKSLI
ncbi:putative winged helix-like DNA-binding domain superfamily [Helianthus annuus]|nr:putative winged helix-like DNA-binding domain superfamily [Helianthus annuus]